MAPTRISLLAPIAFLFCLLQLATAVNNVAYIGYSPPPYTNSKPELFATVSYSFNEDGSASTKVDTWKAPPAGSSGEIQIGLLEAKAKPFAGSTILVSKDLLLDDNLVLQLHLDSKTDQPWTISASSSSLTKHARDGVNVKAPQVKVVYGQKAPAPVLNKPIVLSAEGKVQEAPPEKTLFQKYWWVLLAVGFVAMSGGGGDK